MSEYNIQQKKQFILVYLTDFFPFSDPDFGDTSKFFSPQTSVCFNLFTKFSCVTIIIKSKPYFTGYAQL